MPKLRHYPPELRETRSPFHIMHETVCHRRCACPHVYRLRGAVPARPSHTPCFLRYAPLSLSPFVSEIGARPPRAKRPPTRTTSPPPTTLESYKQAWSQYRVGELIAWLRGRVGGRGWAAMGARCASIPPRPARAPRGLAPLPPGAARCRSAQADAWVRGWEGAAATAAAHAPPPPSRPPAHAARNHVISALFVLDAIGWFIYLCGNVSACVWRVLHSSRACLARALTPAPSLRSAALFAGRHELELR